MVDVGISTGFRFDWIPDLTTLLPSGCNVAPPNRQHCSSERICPLSPVCVRPLQACVIAPGRSRKVAVIRICAAAGRALHADGVIPVARAMNAAAAAPPSSTATTRRAALLAAPALASALLLWSAGVQPPAADAATSPSSVDWAAVRADITAVIADPKSPGGIGEKGPTLVRGGGGREGREG